MTKCPHLFYPGAATSSGAEFLAANAFMPVDGGGYGEVMARTSAAVRNLSPIRLVLASLAALISSRYAYALPLPPPDLGGGTLPKLVRRAHGGAGTGVA